jgi:hypothetical protein
MSGLSIKAVKQVMKESQALEAPPPAGSGTGGSGSSSTSGPPPTSGKKPKDKKGDDEETPLGDPTDPDVAEIADLAKDSEKKRKLLEKAEKERKAAMEERFPDELPEGEFEDPGALSAFGEFLVSPLRHKTRMVTEYMRGGSPETRTTKPGRVGVPVPPSSESGAEITTREGGLKNVTKKFSEMKKQVGDLTKEKAKITGLRKAFDFDRYIAQHLRVRDPQNFSRRSPFDKDIAPFLSSEVSIPRSELNAQQIGLLSALEGTDLSDDRVIVVNARDLAEKVHLLDTKLKGLEDDISKKNKKLGIYETTKGRLEHAKKTGEFDRPITRPKPPEST